MQVQLSWEIIPSKEGKTLYHLGCRVAKNRVHRYLVSVIEDEGLFEIYMPPRSAGSPLLLKRKTKEELESFLREMSYPKLPS